MMLGTLIKLFIFNKMAEVVGFESAFKRKRKDLQSISRLLVLPFHTRGTRAEAG